MIIYKGGWASLHGGTGQLASSNSLFPATCRERVSIYADEILISLSPSELGHQKMVLPGTQYSQITINCTLQKLNCVLQQRLMGKVRISIMIFQ